MKIFTGQKLLQFIELDLSNFEISRSAEFSMKNVL